MRTFTWKIMLVRAVAAAVAGWSAGLAAGDGAPWGIGTAALAQSSNDSAEKEAFEASKALGSVEAWQAFLKNFPTGFRADLARAYISKLTSTPAVGDTSAQPAPTAPRVAAATGDAVTLNATSIRVGKWPERAAFDGQSLWVSESGTRTIVEIDLGTRSIGRRQKVGRLPVDMVATENRTIYALARTDNLIYALAPGGREQAGEFAEVPRCAELMAYAANTLWVVSNLNCSAPGVLTRVSHLNGRTAKVASLAAGAADIKAAHGLVYVAHMGSGGRAAFVSIVDGASGSATASPDLPLHAPRLAANGSAVFIGGAPLDQNTGVVLKVPAGQADFAAQRRLPEAIVAIAATEEHVIAAGRQGTLFVLASADLSLERTITTRAAIQARDLLAIDATLAVVSSAGNEVASDNAVYLIDGWRPGSVAGAAFVPVQRPRPPRTETAPAAAPAPAPAPAKVLTCADGYRKVKGECVLIQNCGANAYRSPEGDCYCNKSFVMQNGRCVERQAQPQKSVVDNCPGDSVLKNGKCVKEDVPELKAPIACKGGQLYSLSQQKCVCQDGLKWNGQRCYL